MAKEENFLARFMALLKLNEWKLSDMEQQQVGNGKKSAKRINLIEIKHFFSFFSFPLSPTHIHFVCVNINMRR